MSGAEPNRNDILALDRTRMAAERTLMAWLRTSLSMISFGFTIYKFLQAFQDQGKTEMLRPEAPRRFGVALIVIGTFALILACYQHRKYKGKLDNGPSGKPFDLAFAVACLVALLGLLILGGIFIHAGPFD